LRGNDPSQSRGRMRETWAVLRKMNIEAAPYQRPPPAAADVVAEREGNAWLGGYWRSIIARRGQALAVPHMSNAAAALVP